MTRTIPGYSNLGDLPAVNDDVAVWNEGVQKFGVSEMINRKDQSKEQLLLLFKELRKKLTVNDANGKKTLVMFLLASHCLMKNTSFAVCNTDDPRKVDFNIEAMLRNLGQSDNAYVFALLVACRSPET